MLKSPIFIIIFALLSLSCWAQERQPEDPGLKYLTQDITTYVKKDGTSTKKFKIEMKVTTQYGATQASIFEVSLPQSNSTFKLIRAIVTTDHHLYPTRHSKVDKTTQSARDMKWGLTAYEVYKIPLSHVKIGSSIYIEYEITNPPLLSGIFQDQSAITNEFFAEHEIQKYISELPLKIQTHGFKDFYTARRFVKNGKYIFKISATPMAHLLEGKMIRYGTFFLTSADSWAQMSQQLSPPYQEAISSPLPEEFQKIVQMASQKKDSASKIEAVAASLKKLITYSGDWRTEKGKFYPAGHQKVVKSGKGDCKDFATSMAAILRKLGFTANVALSYRSLNSLNHSFMKKMAHFPSLTPFNHAIVHAKDPKGKQWWIDPTNPNVIADVLSSDLLGNFALVLDGKSASPIFLPEQNKQPWKSKWNQVIEILPDDSVKVTSHQEYNDTSFNTIALIESLYGKDQMGDIFSRMIHPLAKSEAQYTFSETKSHHFYDVSLTSKEWVDDEKQKRFSVDVPPLISSLIFSSPRAGADVDLGEIGVRERVTLLKGHKSLDPIQNECVIRSPWFDFEREVEWVKEGTKFTDRYVVKKRYIPYDQSEEDEASHALGKVNGCFAASRVVTFLDPSQKTVAEAELDKLRGPAVDQMTEEDANALWNLDNHSLDSYVEKKLYRYYAKRLEKNPKDAYAAAKKAMMLHSMSFLVADKHIPSYLESALDELKEVEKRVGAVKETRFYYVRGICQISLGRKNEARATLNQLRVLAPESYDYASLRYNYYLSLKQYPQAEKWLKVALKKATRPHDKMFSQSRLAGLLSHEKKYAEAAQAYAEVLKAHPKDAWEWHNAAINYLHLKAYDRCVAYEKRAIGIMEFGAAKHTLARALLEKSADQLNDMELMKKQKIYGQNQEGIILEALKWDPTYAKAHIQLANIYANRYAHDQDANGIEKAREFLKKAIALDQRYLAKAQFEMNRLDILEKTKRDVANTQKRENSL